MTTDSNTSLIENMWESFLTKPERDEMTAASLAFFATQARINDLRELFYRRCVERMQEATERAEYARLKAKYGDSDY